MLIFFLQYRLQPTEMTKLFCANDENGLGGFKLILNSECNQSVFFHAFWDWDSSLRSPI